MISGGKVGGGYKVQVSKGLLLLRAKRKNLPLWQLFPWLGILEFPKL